MDAQSTWLVAGWATLHLLGLLAAWVSRLSICPCIERTNQCVLGGVFLAIAGLTVWHLTEGYELSLLSATTLGAMVIAAVFDCQRDAENRELTSVMAAYAEPASVTA